MTVGLPVVALATTEVATVLVDGVNGFASTDVERLIGSMRELLADRELARQIGDAGRRTALDRFAIGRFVADWDRLLRSLCGPVGLVSPGTVSAGRTGG